MRIAPMPADLVPDAVALWTEAGLTRPWNDPVADCRRALVGPDSTVLAARDDAGLVGTAMIGHDGHRGWVYYLAVADRCRGRGLGRQLMEACETWLRAREIPKVHLMVRRENAQVLEFYAHLGYEPSDAVVMARRLDA
jgi:ribosomal protein S18 acetylase RimI-like enzyme